MPARFQAAVELLGKPWTLLIVRLLLDGPKRFGEIDQTIEVISDPMLSKRLKELEAAGLVLRNVLPTTPVSVVYELTKKGHALGGVIDAIQGWADAWLG